MDNIDNIARAGLYFLMFAWGVLRLIERWRDRQ